MAWITSVILLATASTSAAAFEAPLPNAALPPLLQLHDGTTVTNVTAWPKRRAVIRALMTDTFTGTFPDETPSVLSSEIVETRKPDDGSTRHRIELTFATKNNASFETWLWIPQGDGPFPLLMTAPRYYQIDWAKDALARGYMVCLYPGVDRYQAEKDFAGYESVWETFRAEYPTATWTEIACKGWLAGRALDHILDPAEDYPIASGQVGIIGHSRYGKQSMIAAAFDERITAVVARSPGSPASCPYRFTSRDTFMETVRDYPGSWFLESLKGYYGREDELPIDAHGWYALIAPRHLMIHTAHQDGCEPTWAVEQGYLEGRKVYGLLGASDNCRVVYRQGSHNPITAEHRRQNIDWFDLAFGRGDATPEDFPEEFLHRLDWKAWKAGQDPEALTPPPAEATSEARINWVLGSTPDKLAPSAGDSFISSEDSKRMDHDRWATEDTARIPVNFGDGVRGNLYHNPSGKGPAPVVIWLHPYSYSTGYNEGYGVEGTTIYHRLANEGYAVLAFDQVGFGLRLLEGSTFYEDSPQWSKLGRMVHDVRSAVDFVIDGTGQAALDLPEFDKENIYLVGYAMGGMLGLHAAALDERISGVASFSGFAPFRSDSSTDAPGGLQHVLQAHALLPKLELFQGREAQIPYDIEDLFQLIAPRPCLIVSPLRDRTIDATIVADSVRKARTSMGAIDNSLVHETPDDINRFQRAQQDRVLTWLSDNLTQ
jgi:dienelactone hydrolase